MFETIEHLAAGWRTIGHITEWTGLSLGALAAIALVVWYDPRVLKPAIGAAAAVGLLYGGTLYGDRTGRADVEAQWADARQAAIAAEQERDQMAEQQLETRYRPRLDALQGQAADNKRKADDYERKLLAAMAKDAGGKNDVKSGIKPGAACELGAAAERVHGPPGEARDVRQGRRKARGRPAGGV